MSAGAVAGVGAKFAAKRIPILGAIVTLGFAINETVHAVSEKGWGAGAAALSAGLAESAGNIVGFGVGDALRQGAVEAIDAVAGEEYRPEDSIIYTVGKLGYEYATDDGAPAQAADEITPATVQPQVAELSGVEQQNGTEQTIGDNDMGLGSVLLKKIGGEVLEEGAERAVKEGVQEGAERATIEAAERAAREGVEEGVEQATKRGVGERLASGVVDGLEGGVSTVAKTAVVGGTIVAGGMAATDYASDAIDQKIEDTKRYFDEKVDGALDSVTGFAGDAIGDLKDTATSRFGDMFSSENGGFLGAIVGVVTALVTALVGGFTSLMEGFTGNSNDQAAAPEAQQAALNEQVSQELPVPNIEQQKEIVNDFVGTEKGQEAMVKTLGDDGSMGINEAERTLRDNPELAATGISTGELTKHVNDFAEANPDKVAEFQKEYTASMGQEIQNIDLADLGAKIGVESEVNQGLNAQPEKEASLSM